MLLGRTINTQGLTSLKYTIFWKWGIVIFGLMLLMTLVTSLALKRSLELLIAGVDRFSKGDFKEKIPFPDPLEITLLAKALNELNIACIIQVVDDNMDARACHGNINCKDNQKCLTHDLWNGLTNYVYDYLEHV
jgi:methyl-accepting chemotaxis protein